MIDFVKYRVIHTNPDTIEGNPLLDFYNKVNTKTGELGKYINAFHRGLEFRIYEPTATHPDRRITLEGSLHKYWNNGAHNFNDFGINEINEVLNDIESKFSIRPENCILKALEIGVNILPQLPTKTVLRCCLFHKTNQFKWIFTKDEGNYIQAEHQKYIVKIYDKRLHYQNQGFKIPNEIMRFEIKYTKMHQLNTQGIYSLADLLKYGLDSFSNNLLKEWQNVLFYDLTAKERLSKYSNPNYWESLPYEQFRYQRKKLELNQSKNSRNLKNIIAQLITEKYGFLNTKIPEITPLHIGVKTGIHSNQPKDENRRFCKVTGLNISMQKESSFLLSHTGLKYYLETDKKIYDEVRRKYLTDYWANLDKQTEIKEIAHNIRNEMNNQRNRQGNLYPAHQTRLFQLSI